jgi:hypothetical protein
MTSDSATKVPTQQSVKAYVDANAWGGGAPSMFTIERVLTTASGSVSYAHGLWSTPSLIKFDCIWTEDYSAFGFYDWTNNKCIYTTTGWWQTSSTKSIWLHVAWASAYQNWEVTSVDGTNITISRTKSLSPSGNGYVLVTCRA